MKGRIGVVLLVLFSVFACAAVFSSPVSASVNPYFQYCTVWAYNTSTEMKTALDAVIIDPDGTLPASLASVTVSGPGSPPFSYEFLPADYQGGTSNEYWRTLSGLPADGEYVFTATDINGKSGTCLYYLTVDDTVPLSDSSAWQASGANILTPTLSWSTIPNYPGNLFYRVKITTPAGTDVWVSSRLYNATSVTAPSGYLQPGQAYNWRVDVFDNFTGTNSNNRSTPTSIPLALSAAPHPYFTNVGAFEMNDNGSIATGFFIQGADPPGAVASLVVTGPGGAKTTWSASCFTPSTSCSYSIPGAPADGLYTFEAKDLSDKTLAVSYFHLESYSVPQVEPKTMHASGNPLTPVLSWCAPESIDRPLYYVAAVRDAQTKTTVWSDWTLGNAISVPQGKLQENGSYEWRIAPNDSEYFTTSNRSLSPWTALTVDNSSPYFWYVMTYNRSGPDGNSTGLHASVRNRSGAYPGNLTSLTVTGPGGLHYSFDLNTDFWSGTLYHVSPGVPESGLYTFTLTDDNGSSVVTHYYHRKVVGTIPLFNEGTFQVSGSPLTPTISWNAVADFPHHLNYRLVVEDQWGNQAFIPSAPYGPTIFQSIPSGRLVAGPAYRYRVEGFDSRYTYSWDSRVVSGYHNLGVPSVSGRVTNAEGTGLANISVQAYNAVTGASTPTVPTDENGDYLLSNLPSGNYRIFFSGVGYFSEWYNNKTSQPSADLVTVTAPNLTTGIDAVMERSGVISGTVTNALGVGLQYVWVHVHGPDGSGLFGTSTDQLGRYALSNLATGSYKIRFNAPQGYLTECYNNKATLDTADLIPVTVPDMTNGIDAVLGPGGSISGTVRNGQGTGVQGVQVQVYDLSGNWAASPTTNQNGVYTANGLAAGSYRVFFSPPSGSGYTSEWYNNKSSQGSADPVAVTVPNVTANIDAVLEQGGSVSGTIRNDQGVGIANARVQVYDATDTGPTPKATVYTTANGSYTVIGLPTGSYRIFFSADCFFSEWYSNRTDRSTADPVPVTAGQSNSGIDAVLEASGCISGTVTNEQGVGIWNVNAQLFDAGGYLVSNAITDSTGRYTVSNLAAGNYKIRFNAPQGYLTECYSNKATVDTADLIPVTAAGITPNIDAVLGPGGSINGTVRNVQGAGLQGVQVQVYELGGNWATGAMTNQNGTYTANGLAAGSYRLFFFPPSGSGYSSKWYNDKPNQASADTVVVTVPNVTTGIDAVLDVGGSLSGSVRNEAGAGIANARVQVYDAAAADMSAPPKATAFTDQIGSFTVTGLSTGSYKIFFSADCYFSEWYNDKKEGFADPVQVTSGQTNSGIDAVLEASGCISGTVSNGAGVGLGNVWVQVSDANWYGFGGTPTNQDGSYTVSSLPAGYFRVCFYGPPGYRYECYNDKTTQDSGDLVAVTLPGLTSGIDAVLDPGGRITGTVTKSKGAPFADVDVQVFHPNGMWASGVRTNQDGDYSAYGLAAGSYQVFFSPPSGSGYSSEWYNNRSNQEAGDLVTVTALGVTTGIDAKLAQGGSITGRVKNGAGVGIPNVQVQVYDAADTNMNSPRATVTTNEKGNYTAPGLPTGSYRLFFWALGYYSEWYDDKIDQATADPVKVTAPETTSGKNVVLKQSGGITGTVKSASGGGLPNVWVNVFDADGNFLFGTPTDHNGVYTANSLGTGNYKLCFNAPVGYRTEWYNDKATQESADWVAVTVPGMRSGIDAVLEAGGSISGTVRNGQGAGIPNVGVSVFYLDGSWALGTGTTPNGSYLANGLPAGSYKVQFSPPPESGYSTEWYNNKASQDSAHSIVVSAPNIVSGIDAVLGEGGIITVTSPNSGETWQAGSTHNITWAYAGDPGAQVKIQLLKAGAVLSDIAASAAIGGDGSGSYPWMLPSGLTAGNDYRVKITSVSDGSITDASDGDFAISAQPASITVVNPNGGEKWTIGSAQTIAWAFSGDPGNVKITLLKAGKLVSTLAEAVSAGKDGNGSFSWTIPASQTSGNNYQISVTSTSVGSCTDTSDAIFSIKPPQPISVSTPNGGETWQVGTKYAIKWKYSVDIGATVKIELLKNDAVVKTIAAAAASGSSGTGSYLWPISNNLAYGHNYRIKVTGSANTPYNDISDEVFTVTGPTLDITAPDGGESWLRGSRHNITWTYTGNPGGKVKIQLLKAGTLVQTLTSDASVGSEGQGSFDWTISQDLTGGSKYQIKISHTTFTRCKATSSGNFSIVKVVPASSAGPDRNVAEAEQVKLSGANSTGFDKSAAKFSWSQLDGPSITLSNPAAVEPLFTAPEAGTGGRSLTFQLTVTGADGAEAEDQCIVNVTEGGMPPIAEAGPTQTVMSGQQVVLDGSDSYDPEDDLVRFSWKQLAGPQVTLSDPASAQPAFTAPESRQEGRALVFQLTVTDRNGLRSRDTCIVNVVAANLPPKADAGPDQTVVPGTEVTLDGSKSFDEDGDRVSFRWQQLAGPPVTLSDPTGVQPFFVAPGTESSREPLVFQLTVTDGGNLMDKSRMTVVIGASEFGGAAH